MKTAKKLVAIFLATATILSLAATSVSAIEIGETVEWHFTGDSYAYEHSYAGTLIEGKNDLGIEAFWYEDCPVFEFEAKENGYYLIYTTDGLIAVSESYENNVAKNHLDCYGRISDFYYLTEGTVLICVDRLSDNPVLPSVIIEYIGNMTYKEITDCVESVEIENIEPYINATEYYNGYRDYLNFGQTPERITLTFTDGTKTSFYYCVNYEDDNFNIRADLPNGIKCYVDTNIMTDSATGEEYFEADIGGHNYIKEKITFTHADFHSDFSLLISNLKEFTSHPGKFSFELIIDELSMFIKYYIF